ncbi:MAG: lamin tail domain-containing protein [Gemmatimonadaceae bacterium]|nr:lamin tail domain-containing protein [Gemmatimonadaceae bacterium]
MVKVNEVESNGGTPGDWIELINTGSIAVDLSNFLVKDNDDTRTTRLPSGASIAPGGYYVIEEAVLGFGLGAADAARIYDAAGTLLDSYDWTAHATVTYGRCPDGTGAFTDNTASTKGAANSCGAPPPPSTLPWPGSDDVAVVDGLNVFATNGSGLSYEGAGAGPGVLWAVRNGPGTLFRMIFSGGIWTPDPTNSWATGKLLKYIDGTGNPDSEGVTFAAGGSAGGMYVATERNNDASSISKSVILRVNPTVAGATLTAINQWDITADLPVTGANLGIEAITWLPDSMLVANGFFDDSKARLYAPGDYADHAGGLFLVGVEANGNVYAYALNHTTNTFTRVATFSSGFATLAGGSSIMDLAYDRESGYLWAVCDDSCNGELRIFEIDRTVGSPTRGKFISNRKYARPSTMPNINNEGFTFAPNSECVANRRPVFWADDNETAGHTVRKATMPCGTFAPLVQGIRAGATRRR